MRISEQEYLMHYGVKGMRWGVRKEERRSGRRKPVVQRLGRAVAESGSGQLGIKIGKMIRGQSTKQTKSQKPRPKRKYRTISEIRREEGKKNYATNRAFNDTDQYSVKVIKPMLKKKYGDLSKLSASQKSAYDAELTKLIREYYNNRYAELMK